MRETRTLFDFENYRSFLNFTLKTRGKARGTRSRLAQALRCQCAFISRVLNGQAHFSLEHGIAICRFLGFREEEEKYFLLLVLRERSGSRDLENHFNNQILEIKKKREGISERLQTKELLAETQQEIYYEKWYIAAIHILTSIPHLQSPEAIADHLKIPLSTVLESLFFLESCELVDKKGNTYSIGKARIHLRRESPMIRKLHTNWRLRAIQSLDFSLPNAIHYSSVISLSDKNRERFRNLILRFLEEAEPLVQDSGESGAYCINLDFFEV